MNERKYQLDLIKKIERMLPGCIIVKNDPRFRQGVPDILILYNERWAMLEIKLHGGATFQPNQEYYVEMFDKMSFASFINPENEEDVLHDLQRSLRVVRETRAS